MTNYKIHLKDFGLSMGIGIHDDEKARSQKIIIDLSLTCALPAHFSIERVVDYDQLCQQITALCHQRHYDLLEELAETITSHCLTLPQVVAATITITKPDALGGAAIPMISWQKSKQSPR